MAHTQGSAAAEAVPTTVASALPEAERVSGRPLDLHPSQRIVRVTDGPLWDRAERFVHDWYVEVGYTQPSPSQRVTELEPYAERSSFNLVLDDRDQIVGSLRNIYGTVTELPFAKFERTEEPSPGPLCELSSLVVDPRARSTGVIEHLYRAGWLDAWRAGARGIVALIDPWLFDVFVDSYRLPFRRLGPGHPYMGGVPLPTGMDLDGPAYENLARTNPAFWAWTLEALRADEVVAWDLPIVLEG